MASLNMRRITLGEPGAAQRLARLRSELSAQGNVVSERGRELTLKVFGEPLPPQQVVERICADVRKRGLPAVLEYTQHFDRARINPETLRVSPSELHLAHAGADLRFLETV